MDSKTLTTILGVFICVLLFPVAIGIIGGIFGVIGSVIGAIFGVIGGIMGAVFGVIGGIFGAIFGVFGWIFEGLFSWHWPFGFFSWNFFTIAVLVLTILLIRRSKTSRSGR